MKFYCNILVRHLIKRCDGFIFLVVYTDVLRKRGSDTCGNYKNNKYGAYRNKNSIRRKGVHGKIWYWFNRIDIRSDRHRQSEGSNNQRFLYFKRVQRGELFGIDNNRRFIANKFNQHYRQHIEKQNHKRKRRRQWYNDRRIKFGYIYHEFGQRLYHGLFSVGRRQNCFERSYADESKSFKTKCCHNKFR